MWLLWFQICKFQTLGDKYPGYSDEHYLEMNTWNLVDAKSALVLVMAWCHHPWSHHENQFWLRSPTPYGIARQQWVNPTFWQMCYLMRFRYVLHTAMMLKWINFSWSVNTLREWVATWFETGMVCCKFQRFTVLFTWHFTPEVTHVTVKHIWLA